MTGYLMTLDEAVAATKLPIEVIAWDTGAISVSWFPTDDSWHRSTREAMYTYIALRTRLMAAAIQAYRVAEDDRGNLVDQV